MTETTPGSGPAGDSPPAGEPGASRGTVPVQGSQDDLPAGTPTGAQRATDEAPAQVVGARRPLDLG
ncbi:MAG: glycolate oxidase, partial [Actinomycetota bacterium]|nr:glycolate oxidase [Actinomycetota bacterium]